MAEKTELDKPTTEEQPKKEFNVEEILELAPTGAEATEQSDELVQKFKSTEQTYGAEKPEPAEPVEKPEPAEQPEQQPEQPEQQPEQVAKSTKEQELEEQLQFYRTLYGDQPAQQYDRQQANQQQQQPQQTQQQQQPQQQQTESASILDNITVNQDELYDFLSGDPVKALPVLKKFLGTAIVLAKHHVQVEQQQAQRNSMYINAVQTTFYKKYEDLDSFRPVVKMAGDQVAAEYAARGIHKYPHEIIDDIGKRARSLLQELATYKNGQQRRVVPKQGEHGSTRIAAPAQEKLTEQQKHMADLME